MDPDAQSTSATPTEVMEHRPWPGSTGSTETRPRPLLAPKTAEGDAACWPGCARWPKTDTTANGAGWVGTMRFHSPSAWQVVKVPRSQSGLACANPLPTVFRSALHRDVITDHVDV